MLPRAGVPSDGLALELRGREVEEKMEEKVEDTERERESEYNHIKFKNY